MVTTNGTRADPVRLDLFQTIRNIQWSGGLIVIDITYDYSGHRPAHPNITIDFPGVESAAVFPDQFIHYADDATETVTIVNPISAAMRANLRDWTVQPYIVPRNSDGEQRGGTRVFINIPKLIHELTPGATRFNIDVDVPAADTGVGESVTFYWAWSDEFGATNLEEAKEFFFTTGDPRPGHTGEIILVPIAFGTAGERDDFITAANSVAAHYHAADEVASGSPYQDHNHWNVSVGYFRPSAKNFPWDSGTGEGTPDMSLAYDGGGASAVSPFTAGRTVHIEVNMTEKTVEIS
jgi:hypothetical protein